METPRDEEKEKKKEQTQRSSLGTRGMCQKEDKKHTGENMEWEQGRKGDKSLL